MQRESVRLQKALNSISHGKHIFAYHNVRTKQVVYSLTRYLEVSNLFFLLGNLIALPAELSICLRSCYDRLFNNLASV